MKKKIVEVFERVFIFQENAQRDFCEREFLGENELILENAMFWQTIYSDMFSMRLRMIDNPNLT